MTTLKHRISEYQSSYNYKILPKLPIVYTLNGRNFSKITQNLQKPYSKELNDCLSSTLLRLCTEIEGAVFGYSYNDELIIISKNDGNCWYDNNIQKLASVTSSIATVHFNNMVVNTELDFTTDAIFTCEVSALPNLTEVLNFLIFKQQHNFQLSLNFACYYELLKSNTENEVYSKLENLAMEDKIDFLREDCGVEYTDYPENFRRGLSVYKVPKLVNSILKNKWQIDNDTVLFSKEQEFIANILKSGSDIFRK